MLRYRSDRGPIRSIHVQIDEYLYRRLERYCDVASLTKVVAVQRGVKAVLNEASKRWPAEYLAIPELLTTPTD